MAVYWVGHDNIYIYIERESWLGKQPKIKSVNILTFVSNFLKSCFNSFGATVFSFRIQRFSHYVKQNRLFSVVVNVLLLLQ